MFNKFSITDLDLGNNRVFIRVDFNVPLDDKLQITDDTRIIAALPTIQYARDHGAKVILASHLGRPKGQFDETLSLKPVAVRLSSLLNTQVKMAPDCIGPEVEKLSLELKPGEILLLENLRFHPGETGNDPDFAKSLASITDLYVNDAFGAAHRSHASIEGITHYIDKCASGFLLEQEIEYFDTMLSNPERPYLALIGGAKISSKIPVIENLIDKVDRLLIGGGMAFTFFKALGKYIGSSLLEEKLLGKAEEFLNKARMSGMELMLPVDLVVAAKFDNKAERRVVDVDSIPDDWMGLDIGPATVESWKKIIHAARTIVWNGPMGAFEMSNFSNGTVEIACAIASSKFLTIVGGGDSIAALEVAGVRNHISHVSTGGGASLDFLAGKKLPGIDSLADR